jgi:hypothetical protein
VNPLRFFLLVVGIVALMENRGTAAEPNAVPLIVIDDVPLTDAVKNLARQADLNFILDPCVPGSGFRAGAQRPNENVSIRLTNVSVASGLAFVLKKHKLMMITNSATTVARIVPTNHNVKPVAASAVLPSKDAPVAAIALDDVSLGQTISTLARQAGAEVIFDPSFTRSEFGKARVSFRWMNLNAAQALAALLDNYDLQLVKEPGADEFRLSLKPPQQPDPHAGNLKR